jgi:hypothetical protein
MLMDSASSHILPDEEQRTVKGFEVYKRENVTIVFLPNYSDIRVATPLNHGIFGLVKAMYRIKFIQWVIDRLQNPEAAAGAAMELEQSSWTLRQYRPDFLQFLTWIQNCWDAVTPHVIALCWGRSGIMSDRPTLPPPPTTAPIPEDCTRSVQLEIDRLARLIEPRRAALLGPEDSMTTGESYIELEGEVVVHAALTDEEIVRIVTSDMSDTSGAPEVLINMSQKPKTSVADARNLASTVLNYMSWHSDYFDHSEVGLISSIAEKLAKQDEGHLI